MKTTVEMDLEYLNTIDHPPYDAKSLHRQAASGDEVTIESWRDTWIANMSKNHDDYGPFCESGIGKLYGEFDLKPCIVAGSGPSLKKNVHVLREKQGIPLISCLHNFHYMVDHDVEVDYFVTLDAGKITIPEISEGGKHDHEYYLEKTKDYTLCAFVGSDPELIKSWKGRVLWFACPIPDQQCKDAFDKKEVFHNLVSNGGNVLGAAIYIAKAYGGANPIALIGADYCFDYTKKFHAWDSKYDGKLGNAMRTVDCYGNKVLTWGSYLNFKRHADSIALRVPGEWINCTEGGTWGVYPEGLLKHIRHKPLKEFIDGYKLYRAMQFQAEHPENACEDTGIPGTLPQPKIFF